MKVKKLIASIVFTLFIITIPNLVVANPTLECSSINANQVEIGNCINEQADIVLQTVDQALGFAMQAAVELDSETGRQSAVQALQAGQEAWVSYRDAHCAYVAFTFGGGSGTDIAEAACHVSLGRDRTDSLMEYVR